MAVEQGSFLVDEILPAGAEFGQAHQEEISRLVDVADLSLLEFEAAESKIRESLQSKSRWERYWSVVACCSFGKSAQSLEKEVLALAGDPEVLVQLRVAEFQAVVLNQDPRPIVSRILTETDSPVVAAIAMNSAVFLQDRTPSSPIDFEKVKPRATNDEVKRRLLYFSGKTK